MRHLLWLAPLAVLVAVAAYWTTIRPELAGPPVALKTAPCCVTPSTETPVRDEVIEPILVLREVEMLPAPEAISDPRSTLKILPITKSRLDFTIPPFGVPPRPEVGRDTRAWMPYAAEDGDLAAQRKLQWARLIIDESKVMPWAGDTEETSEPPLFER